MYISFIIPGCILFVTIEFTYELLVCIGVLRCGCPIYIHDIICVTDLRAFTYIAIIYASTSDVMTASIIWVMFNTAPFLSVFRHSLLIKFPLNLIIYLGLMRWDVLLLHHNNNNNNIRL